MSRRETLEHLEGKARALRLAVIQMIGVGQTGHVGGSCSAADLVAALYFHKMKHDSSDPAMPDRDRFLLSKGHAAIIQYAALAESGYFDPVHLTTLKQMGSILQGHPDMLQVPGVEANTGSLGQGLSIAAGMAAALKMDKTQAKVYCMIGDGEVGEGQIWEAAMSACHYELDNLVAIVDANGLRATGEITNCLSADNLARKFEAFGFSVLQIDGHDMASILEALDQTDEASGRPYMIIAETVKGKGIPCAENNVSFHNASMTADQYEEACQILRATGE